ncbi:hypothetical protein CBL_02274 [Carabus blaptoides fortunei]
MTLGTENALRLAANTCYNKSGRSTEFLVQFRAFRALIRALSGHLDDERERRLTNHGDSVFFQVLLKRVDANDTLKVKFDEIHVMFCEREIIEITEIKFDNLRTSFVILYTFKACPTPTHLTVD